MLAIEMVSEVGRYQGPEHIGWCWQQRGRHLRDSRGRTSWERSQIHLRGSASSSPFILNTLVSYSLPYKSSMKNVNNALRGFTSNWHRSHILTHVSHSEISLEITGFYFTFGSPL